MNNPFHDNCGIESTHAHKRFRVDTRGRFASLVLVRILHRNRPFEWQKLAEFGQFNNGSLRIHKRLWESLVNWPNSANFCQSNGRFLCFLDDVYVIYILVTVSETIKIEHPMTFHTWRLWMNLKRNSNVEINRDLPDISFELFRYIQNVCVYKSRSSNLCTHETSHFVSIDITTTHTSHSTWTSPYSKEKGCVSTRRIQGAYNQIFNRA